MQFVNNDGAIGTTMAVDRELTTNNASLCGDGVNPKPSSGISLSLLILINVERRNYQKLHTTCIVNAHTTKPTTTIHVQDAQGGSPSHRILTTIEGTAITLDSFVISPRPSPHILYCVCGQINDSRKTIVAL